MVNQICLIRTTSAFHILDRKGIPSNEACEHVVATDHTAGTRDEKLSAVSNGILRWQKTSSRDANEALKSHLSKAKFNSQP